MNFMSLSNIFPFMHKREWHAYIKHFPGLSLPNEWPAKFSWLRLRKKWTSNLIFREGFKSVCHSSFLAGTRSASSTNHSTFVLVWKQSNVSHVLICHMEYLICKKWACVISSFSWDKSYLMNQSSKTCTATTIRAWNYLLLSPCIILNDTGKYNKHPHRWPISVSRKTWFVR